MAHDESEVVVMDGEYFSEGEAGRGGCVCPICGSRLQRGPIEIKERYVVANGKMVRLSPAELLIFSRLLVGFPEPVAREVVYDGLDARTFNTHICHIRQKVAIVGLRIKTVYGVGFRLLDSQMEAVA